MAYTITITYKSPAAPDRIDFVSPICSFYSPDNSYVDTKAYEGTVYDTNTKGFGKIDLMEPYASTSFPFPVPLAQFKLATVGTDVKESGVVVGKKVEFTVDTYMEAYWYAEAGRQLADQGFTVTIAEKAA
ncbi:MAG: hypothetical protein NC320_03205 [Clostridium sp.]|nr:hypothetical protein [Clostridium sp.]